MSILKIKAEIEFHTLKDMSKREYFSGYMPEFKIREDMYNSGQITFTNEDSVYSGDKNIEVEIIFAHGELVSNYLFEGKRFDISEGRNVVGSGIVSKILKE